MATAPPLKERVTVALKQRRFCVSVKKKFSPVKRFGFGSKVAVESERTGLEAAIKLDFSS